MKLSQRVSKIKPSATLEITALAKKLKSEGKDIVAFTAGEPDFNTPDFIVKSAEIALKQGFTKYTPTAGTEELRRAVAGRFREKNGIECDEKNIVVSSGAKSSLYHAVSALVDEGDEVIIPSPYWVTYTEQVELCGGVPVLVKTTAENGYKMTAGQLENAITDKTRCLIINSPCNPTGAVYTCDELKSIAEVCEKRAIDVISDEIYENLVFGDSVFVSFATLSEYAKNHTVTINGVSKSYAMTGWRIGYLCAPAEVAKAISAMQGHTTSNACSISQFASVAAIEHGDEFICEMRAEFERRRNVLVKNLTCVDGLEFCVPDGAFYLFADVSAFYGRGYKGEIISDSQSFAKALLDFGVAVIPGAAFGNDNCVRLSYSLGTDDIVKGTQKIKAFLSGLQKN